MSRILGDVFQILNGNVGLGTTLPRQRFDIDNGHVILQGNLGIGTTDPLYTLDTRGDINFSGILRQNGTPYISSQWSTNGTNLYYNDGNVGIGTNLPQSQLHVIGDIRASQTIYASNLQVTGLTIQDTITSNTQQLTIVNEGSGPALSVKQTGVNYIAKFYHNDDVILTLADGGLIGINTATPRAPLDIIGDTILTGNIGFGTTQALARLYVRHFDTGTDDIFRVDNTNANSTSLIVDHNGNVGIGTSQPKYSLDVYGNAKITGSVTAGSFLGTATQVSQTLIRGAYLTGTNYNGSVATTWAVDADSANTANKVVVRDASGNFSAGTITATALSGSAITDSISTTSSSIAASATAVKNAYDLAGAALPKTGGTVTGAVTILANLTASNLTVIGDSTILNTITSNTEQMVITNAGTGPALKVTQSGDFPVAEFYDNESGLAMTIANNGNIGIGSTIPMNKLDVLGNVYVSGTITGTLNGTATQVSQNLVRGTYLTGTNYNGSVTTIWAVDADSANTANKVVVRDASGNFSAGTITATLSGTATKVSQDLVKGAYLSGTNYNGAGTTTWAVDATTTAVANKVAVRDSLGALYANYLGINTSNLSRTVSIGGDIYVTNTAIAQKLLIRGTEPVLYPPAFLTTDSETLSGYSYGNGTYTVTESSSLSSVYKGWKMFNGTSNTPEACWATNVNLYTDTGGGYIGATSTVIDGRTYYGEWAQIQMPVTTILSSYEVAPRIDDPYYTARRSPRTWYLAGSSNGSSWSMVDVQTSNVWVHPNSKIVDVFVNTKSFSYYRLIVNEVGNVSTPNDNGAAFVGELKLYGRTSNDGTMIVYGDTVLNGKTLVNTLTASNIGIGTTMAIYPLHVEGNTYLNGSVTTNNNNINAGTGTITAATFTGTATKVSQDLVRGAYLTGINYNGAGTTTWAVDADSANTANKVVVRDASGNFSAGTITATLSGTATKVSQDLVKGAYLTGINYNGAGTTTWAVDAESANTANKVVVRDASGNFSAGTITASLTGTATKVSQDLIRGSYLTGTNYNGAGTTTWAVDAESANTANKVVVRDASGNFSAGTITASLTGTATKVSQDLVRGSYLTGTNYNGAGTTTWAVDADSANTANKVVVRDASGNFSAGTITASLTGTATKVSQDLVRGSYLTGTNYNGAGTTTWAVDADSANTANKVVVRDASGNFSAGTITATLTGTATKVSQDLVRGTYLTGTNYNGAGTTTWEVDATTTATASKIVARDASAYLFASGVGIGTTTARQILDIQGGGAIVSGNVGIGTTNPVVALTVGSGPPDVTSTFMFNSGDTVANTDKLYWTYIKNGSKIGHSAGWNVNHYAGQSNTAAAPSNGNFHFFTGGPEYNERLTILNNGNVGIGSTVPAYRLDIAGNAFINGTVITNNNNINAGTGTIVATTFSGTATKVSQDLVKGTYLTGANYNGSVATTWAVDADSANTASKVVVRDASGNFSAGTITATALSGTAITDSTSTTSSTTAASATAVKSAYDLANAALPKTGGLVTGDVTILANLTTSNLTVIGESTILNTITSNTEQMVITNAGTGPALKVTQSGAYPVAEFYDNESGLAMTIANDGNIGIGSTTPFNKLDVIGDAYVSGTITGTLLGTATKVGQDLVRGAYLTGSDYNGAGTTTWDVDATTTATVSKIVARDTSGGIYVANIGIGTTSVRQLLDIEGGNAIVSGRIGIGTTNPRSKLHIYGYPILGGTSTDTGVTRFLSILDSTITNGISKYLTFGKANSTNNQAEISYTHQGDGSATNFVAIGLYGSVGININGDGNVGIGTYSPEYRFHVIGNSYLNGPIITNNNNINAGSGTVTATTFSGTATQVSQNLTRGSYLTGNDYNGSVATTWAVDADSANTANKVVVRDGSGNFSAGTITATLSGTATQVSQDLIKGAYLTGTNYNGSVTTTWEVDADSANTANKVVVRDGSGNFSAGTITATLSGTATQVSSTLTRGSYLTGNDFTGASPTTWAVDADSANTASKVVVRDGSGNFSAGTITASLSGTATKVSQDLVRGAYLTGTNYNGAGATTWAVDATTIATASKIVARDASAYLFASGVGIGTGTARQILDVQGGGAIISGNVGIGTTNPLIPLHVIGTNSNTIRLQPPGGASGNVSTIQLWGTFGNYPADTQPRYSARITSGFQDSSTGIWGSEYLAFGVGNNGSPNDTPIDPLEKVRITSTGRVGIGTTNPGYKLEVAGDINYTGTLYQNGIPAGSGGGSSQWTTVVSDIYFTAGNVGIGTTAPLSKLHVGAYPILIGNSTDTDHGRFISALDSTLTDGTAKYISIGKTNSLNNQAEFSYYHVSDGSPANYAGLGLYGGSYLHVTGAGNVGIGTTTPQSKFVVEGTTLLNGTVTTNNNNINAGSGTITATTFSGTATQVSSILTRGSYLTGNDYNGSVATTWAVDADSANTANKVVVRDASGNFSASNVTLNQLTTSNLLILDASYTTKYQIAPIRNVVYIDSGPRSTFTLSTNGYFGGNASNVHIFVDNSKLSYYSATINDYQLALSYDNINDITLYTVTLTTAAVFGNVVDITIWPQVLQESLPNAQRFYQRVDVQSDFISSGSSLYYLAGNVGIGTITPRQLLDVQGGNAIFSANVGIGTTNADYRLVVGDNTIRDEIIKVDSQRYAGLILNGDTANTVGEVGGAYVHMRIDSASISGTLGMCQIADQDARGNTLTGSIANGLLLYHNQSYPIQFGNGDSVKMTLSANGNVGIGTTSPFANLHIAGTTGTAITGEKQLYIAHATTANCGWYIGNQTAGATAGDNDLYFAVNRDGTISEPAFIQDNVTPVTQMNFTGQHRCFVKDMSFSNLLKYEGLIVSANQNKYIRMSNGIAIGKDAITISESLPIVTFTSNAYDKSIFGVIASIEDPDNRKDEYGAFVSVLHKEKGDTRAYINSVGEGAIWVADINGPLESGDYITSSILPGYGMKQNDDILRNYTVAKITMNCDFNPQQVPKFILLKDENGENILDSIGNLQWTPLIDESGQIVYESEYDIRYLQDNGIEITADAYHIAKSNNTTVYKAAFVGCTYHCG